MHAGNFKYKWWALIGLSFLSFTAFLDVTIVTTALPFIRRDLHATVLQLQWVITIFGMMQCMFMIAVGRAAELWGRKRVFYFGFVLFLIAAFGTGYAPTIDWLIFFRAVQGIATPLVFTVGISLLPQVFPQQEQTRALAVFSTITGIGLAIGPFLGGVLIAALSWRWVFFINIPIILVGLVLFACTSQPGPKPDKSIKMDWWGLVLLIIGMGGFIYGLVHGGQYAWGISATLVPLVVGIIALGLLVYFENKIKDPLLDLRIFKNAHASLAMLICVACGFLYYVFMFFDPLYLQSILHHPPLMVGLILLTFPVMQVVLSMFIEKLFKKFHVLDILLCGLATAFFATVLHFFFTPAIGIYWIVLALMLMGITWGIVNTGAVAGIQASVPADRIGSSIGTVFTSFNISGPLFLSLSSVLFHWRESGALNSSLTNLHLQLTATQRNELSILVSDPGNAQSVLSQFGNQASEITQAFTSSFMQGFHWVSGFAIVVTLIIFIIGVKLRRTH